MMQATHLRQSKPVTTRLLQPIKQLKNQKKERKHKTRGRLMRAAQVKQRQIHGAVEFLLSLQTQVKARQLTSAMAIRRIWNTHKTPLTWFLRN